MDKISRLPPVDSHSLSSFKSLSKVISLFVFGVGCLVLVGWALDIVALKSILPGQVSMKSNTALLFTLCGISLWTQVSEQTRRIAQACAFMVAFVALLTLGEYVFNSDFGIDELLFRDTAAGALYPGRMAPPAALVFLMIGLVLMFLDRQPKKPFNESLLIIAFAISILALIGHIYGVSSLYKIGEYTSMALHTALNFVLLSISILFARPERGLMQTILADTAGGSILRRFLPVVIVGPILLGWIRLWGQRAGLYDTAFGLALMVVSIITTLTIFIWFNARQLTNIDIKRKRMDDSLHASELHFRSTLENMMEGCQVLGHDWRYLFINSSAEKHNRRPNKELLGKIYMDMWPGIESTAVYVGLRHCMDKRIPQHIVNEFIFPDGGRGWFELSIQPVPDGIFILSSDITQRKQAEQALLEREMKLAKLLDILPVGISILDAQSKISYTNRALKEMLDLSEEELLKGTYTNRTYLRADGTLMPVDELARTRALKEKREIDNIETGVVKEDESIVWTNASAVPVDFPDWKVVLVTSDITGRKQAEERFRLATEAAPNAIIMVNQHGQIILVNSQAEKYFGYDRIELMTKSIDNLVPVRFLGNHANHRAGFFSQPQARAMGVGRDLYGLRKDGSEFPMEIGLAPINTQEGMLVLATIVDITERKKGEGDLRANERRLQLAVSAGEVGIWDWDVVKDELIWDESMYALYGIHKKDFRGAYHAWTSTLHPDDRQFTDGEIQAALRGEREYAPEFRIVRPDGVVRVMKATSQTIRNQAGKALRMIGTNIDITERKRAEIEILELNAELEEKIRRRTAELAEANEQLHQLSIIDELTGLYNRRGFLLLAREQFLLAQRARRNLLIFYADLDGLKPINDQLGHGAGDEAIAAAARALNETFRTSDIKARLGGDEFIVLAMEAKEDCTHALLARLHEKLAEKDQSMSVGVVTFDAQNETSIEDLIVRADEAMYIEKRKKPGSSKIRH